VAALHAHGQPVAGRTIAQREYLTGEVVLAQLSPLSHIPRPHCVVQAAREDSHAVRRYINAASSVRVALELSHELLIVHVPHSDVAVTAAAEADLRVR